MVKCMGSVPMRIRRERKYTQAAAEPVIGTSRGEEGMMTAIVLDDEKPNEEAGGQRQQRCV